MSFLWFSDRRMRQERQLHHEAQRLQAQLRPSPPADPDADRFHQHVGNAVILAILAAFLWKAAQVFLAALGGPRLH